MGIIDLITDGFAFTGPNREAYAMEEITQPLPDPQIFYTMHPLRPEQVGTLLIVGHSIIQGCSVLEIGGIFVAKDHPNRGIGGVTEEFLSEVVELYAPDFVVGITRNWKAHSLRDRSLLKDYETRLDSDHPVIREFIKRHNGELTLMPGFIHVPILYLEDLLIPARYPDDYKSFHGNLAKERARCRDGFTSAACLVSVRR